MASLAQTMFQSASDNITKSTPDLAKAYTQGSQLAQAKQAHDLNVQNMERQKEVLQQRKLSSLMDNVQSGLTKVPQRARAAYFKNFIKPQADQLGFPMDDSFTQSLLSPDINQGALMGALSAYQEGITTDPATGNIHVSDDAKVAGNKILEALGGDASQFADFMQKTINNRTTTAAQRSAQQVGLQKQTQAEQAKAVAARKKFEQLGPARVATKVGEKFVEYDAVGGKVVLLQNLKDLEAQTKRLESGEVTTGSLTTVIPGLSSDAVQSRLNQEARNVENSARKAILPLLRATLGSTFTEKEGERIFGTVFDPKAPAKENAKRMRAKLEELKKTIKAKEAAFVRGGHLDASQLTFPDKKSKSAQELSPARLRQFQAAAARSKVPREQTEAALRSRLANDGIKVTDELIQQILGGQ